MNAPGKPNLFPLKTAQLISDTELFCQDVWRSNARVWVKVKTRQLEDYPTFSCSHQPEKQPLDSLLMSYFGDLAHLFSCEDTCRGKCKVGQGNERTPSYK